MRPLLPSYQQVSFSPQGAVADLPPTQSAWQALVSTSLLHWQSEEAGAFVNKWCPRTDVRTRELAVVIWGHQLLITSFNFCQEVIHLSPHSQELP